MLNLAGSLLGTLPSVCAANLGDSLLVEGVLMRRVVQFSRGKILGSAAFVAEMLGLFSDRVRSRSARARAVEGIGFASHGWRLAAMLEVAA